MNIRKITRKCPQCGSILSEFGIDLDNIQIECVRCHSYFYPLDIFNNSEIVIISKFLPTEKVEIFMSSLGFERKPPRRKLRIILYILLSFFTFGIFLLCIMFTLTGEVISSIFAAIVGLSFVLSFHLLYENEEKLRWQKK